MNKFKAWLIRKLGGCVYLEQTERIVFKTLPCVTANVDIQLPPAEMRFDDVEIMEVVTREAADKIGHYIVEKSFM